MSRDRQPIEQLTRRMFIALSGMAVGSAGLGSVGEAAAMSDLDRKNLEVVKGMSAAWKTGDAEKIAAFMDNRISFRGGAQQVAVPAMVGRDNFIKGITGFLKTTTVDMHVLDAFALNPVVVTSHHQLFETKEKGLSEDLYIGCFFLENGKIREWNDYQIVPHGPRQKDTARRGKFVHAM